MAQLRRDPIVGRWVVIDDEHPKGPNDFSKEDHTPRHAEICPFCPGRENRTPLEVDAVRPVEGVPNSSNWQVRTIPNKFPALVHEEHLVKEGIGMFDVISGYGAHEVVIENPSHNKQMTDLTPKEMALVLSQYQRRYQYLSLDPNLKYVVIFKNFGVSAGATVDHSQS
ncbi:MAG: hypothetical protein WCH62_00465 [Candidatus Omnitrophota bacterium]